MTEVLTLPRRYPQQKRSQETVQRVLDAAGSLLTQIPLEFVTASRIAMEARMSIGVLYRFYPDKQSIFDAVAVRHEGLFRRWVEIGVMQPLERERTAAVPRFDPAGSLERLIDGYVKYLEQNPDFRALALGRLTSAGAKERAVNSRTSESAAARTG